MEQEKYRQIMKKKICMPNIYRLLTLFFSGVLKQYLRIGKLHILFEGSERFCIISRGTANANDVTGVGRHRLTAGIQCLAPNRDS
jgi:hypothetical protein